MGRNSGGGGGGTPNNQGGLKPDDSTFKGKIGKLESLNTIKNKYVYKAVGEAISRYHSVMGVRQQNVKLASLPNGYGGVHVTQNGKSSVVVLSKSIFNGKGTTTQSVASWSSKGYESGWSTKTNKPVAHIVTHELAHATWNAHLTKANAKAASPAINKVYKSWLKDKSKKGYGEYAKTNVSEFFAETVTKAVHGKSDKYTKSLKSIVKKYKL
jgi:hypothetical protein